MNHVELSEKIRDHLISQHAKSENVFGSCKYRNADGLMCAVGCLITDEVYDTGLEGNMSSDPVILEALEKSGVAMDEATIAMARAWQAYHDSSYFSNDVQSSASYSYSRWIVSKNEAHSPTTVHEIIIKELAQ